MTMTCQCCQILANFHWLVTGLVICHCTNHVVISADIKIARPTADSDDDCGDADAEVNIETASVQY